MTRKAGFRRHAAVSLGNRCVSGLQQRSSQGYRHAAVRVSGKQRAAGAAEEQLRRVRDQASRTGLTRADSLVLRPTNLPAPDFSWPDIGQILVGCQGFQKEENRVGLGQLIFEACRFKLQGMSSLVGKDIELDAVCRQFEPYLTAGCVCMLVATLRCDLGQSWLLKLRRIPALFCKREAARHLAT